MNQSNGEELGELLYIVQHAHVRVPYSSLIANVMEKMVMQVLMEFTVLYILYSTYVHMHIYAHGKTTCNPPRNLSPIQSKPQHPQPLLYGAPLIGCTVAERPESPSFPIVEHSSCNLFASPSPAVLVRVEDPTRHFRLPIADRNC